MSPLFSDVSAGTWKEGSTPPGKARGIEPPAEVKLIAVGIRIHHRKPETPSTRTIEQLVVRIADRAEEWLSKQGYGTEEQEEPDSDDGQAVLQAAAVMGRAAMGSRRGRRVRRLQVLGGRPYRLPAQCASCDGYGLHAGVVIGARDRKGLERLCRYIARPPLAKSRLETRDDGTVVIRLVSPGLMGRVPSSCRGWS
jgi:hypothetical protein